MDLESQAVAPGGSLAAALRRAGPIRLAIGFFVMCLGSAQLAELLIGIHGVSWLRAYAPAGAAGDGIGFAWMWAFFTGARLARGRSWPRALVESLLPAILTIVLAVSILRALNR